MLVELLGPRAVSVLSDVMFCGMLFVLLVGLIRISYERTIGPWPNNRGTRFLSFAIELFSNVLGAFNKYLSARGTPLMVPPEVAALTAEVERLRAEPIVDHAPKPGLPMRSVTLPDVGRPPPGDDDAFNAARRFVAAELGERPTTVPDEAE